MLANWNLSKNWKEYGILEILAGGRQQGIGRL